MWFSRTRGISFRNSIVDFAFNRHLSANPQHCQFYHQYCRFCHSAICVLMQHREHWRSEDCVPTSRLKMVSDLLSSFRAAKSSCIVDTMVSNRDVSAPNHRQAKSDDEQLYRILKTKCIASKRLRFLQSCSISLPASSFHGKRLAMISQRHLRN